MQLCHIYMQKESTHDLNKLFDYHQVFNQAFFQIMNDPSLEVLSRDCLGQPFDIGKI